MPTDANPTLLYLCKSVSSVDKKCLPSRLRLRRAVFPLCNFRFEISGFWDLEFIWDLGFRDLEFPATVNPRILS